MKYCYTILFFLLITLNATMAQDTHYGTQQYGTRSALLGGAVVAGAPDNSTVFYNPGALGFIENPSISVNANLYRIENITIENALGQQADFRSSQFGSVPILIGGMFKIKSEKWKVGYGVVAPVDFQFKGNARLDDDYAIVDDEESPGAEAFVGESEKSSRLSEVSLNLGVGRKLNENWSVGLTHMFTLRNQTYNRQLLAHMILNDPAQTLVNTTIFQYLKYFDVRYAAKLGIAYQNTAWKLGLTLTTPSLGLFGSGTLAADITAQNMKLGGDTRVNGFASDRQEELKTSFRSPFSVAAGAEYNFQRAMLAFSVQYFGAVDTYDIIRSTPADFVRYGTFGSSLGSEDLLVVLGGARPVLNAVLAYEYQWNEQLSFSMSFRNDMSYLDNTLSDQRGYKTTISSWDIYHLVGGTTIKRERSSMSIGLLLSTGNNNAHEERGAIGTPAEVNLIQGITTITKANYSSIGFLLGYTFNFRKF
ncbi:hypothetical protein WJR50_16540 [Catalinimonas sp. 4WD22]|uniref:OmpP1/FadL family transporter n=1 Tax=Catalinimonas locisalis TaxID=3133978 RepID=UPI0031018E4B